MTGRRCSARVRLLGLGAVVIAASGVTLPGQISGSFELVSVGTAGASGSVNSNPFDNFGFQDVGPSNISADNRYVVFSSTSRTVVAAANGQQQVYVRDRQAGTTTLVSCASDGTIGDSASAAAVISANGRFVVFISTADNLVPGDTNRVTDPGTGQENPASGFDLFVRDLQADTTVRASVSSSGQQANYGVENTAPAISADGRFVAFTSVANNLVPGDTNVGNADIFLRDMVTGTTTRISVRPDGTEIVGADSIEPSISADGRRVAFAVYPNTLAGPTPQVPPNLPQGIYVRDLATNSTILVSALPDGTPAHRLQNGQQLPTISANGRYVSFNSWDDLDPNFPDDAEESLNDGPFSDVFVRDLDTQTTRRVSLPFPGGPAEESGYNRGNISADGRFVVYMNFEGTVVVRDMVANTSTTVTLSDGSLPIMLLPRLSQDASLLYAEYVDDIAPDDTDRVADAYLVRLPPRAGADLSLTLAASTTQPPLGGDFQLIASVVNGGGEDATGVTVSLPLPPGLTPVSSSGSGTYASGTWTVGPLASGSTATVQVIAHVTASTSMTVTAEVMTSSPFDPDSTPGNNDPSEDDQASVTLLPLILTGIVVNDPTGVVDPSDGKCTLVEAIIAANTDAPSGSGIGECAAGHGADTIYLRATTPPYSFTAVYDPAAGLNALPIVTSDITIEADGQTIERSSASGTPNFRLFEIAANGILKLRNAVLRNGYAYDPTFAVRDANRGGAISSHGVLDVQDGAITDSFANCDGGGILAEGPLNIHGHVVIQHNVAGCSGGGVAGFYAGAVTIDNATFLQNSAAEGGGGLYIHGTTTASLTNSTVQNNTAGHEGGGVFTHNVDANLTITATQILGNSTTSGHGGGLSNGLANAAGVVPGGSMSLMGVTVSSNVTTDGVGGGIANFGTLTIVSSRFVANQVRVSPAYPSGFAYGAGGLYSWSSLAVSDSLFDSNTALPGGLGGGMMIQTNIADRPTVIATTTINGNAAYTGAGIYATGAAATFTDLTITGNIATNVGGGIGSYGTAYSLVRSTVRGNRSGASGGGIDSSADNAVIDNTTIDANLAAISGGGLAVSGSAVHVVGGTQILENTAATAGGGIALDGGSLVMDDGVVDGNTANGIGGIGGGGGGLANLHPAGTLTLGPVVISNNHAPNGGGGGILNGGILSMTGGELRNNSAQNGGGLSNGSGSLASGPATLTRVMVNGNIAIGSGGGVSAGGGLTVDGTTISANTAAAGGGIYTAGPATITASTLVGNTAQMGGGLSIFVSCSLPGTCGFPLFRVDVRGSTVSGNTATGDGGGGIDVVGPDPSRLPSGFRYLDLRSDTIVNNSGAPGGIKTTTSVLMFTSILAANRRSDGTVSECSAGGLMLLAGNVVGADASCPRALVISSGAGAPHRVIQPSLVFSTLLGPLADNGGPTATHALLPGSLAIDFNDAGTCDTEQRGLPRDIDGDGDGVTRCDAGAFEQQTPLASPVPVITSLTPTIVAANSAPSTITITGTGFMAQAVAQWNGSPRATFVRSTTQLDVTLLASDLSTTQPVTTGLVTVANPASGPSNALLFDITGTTVTQVQSVPVAPQTTGTASTAPIVPGLGGVTATLTHTGAAPGAVTAASYSTNPVGGTVFAAGGFYDVQVVGASASDSLSARFYYPNTVTGGAETALQLLYWNGTAWIPAAGSGGSAPVKNTTDNLDGTISGGRFALTFDATSTPAITGLTGTVFAIATVTPVAVEAGLQFDPATRSIAVVSAGATVKLVKTVLPGNGARPRDCDREEMRTYSVTNPSGSSLTLVVDVKLWRAAIKARIVSVQRGSERASTPPPNTIAFDWSLAKGGGVGALDQLADVGAGPNRLEVEATFTRSKNQTIIVARLPKPEKRSVKPGLALIQLATMPGGLSILAP